jgi:hypothetical protein
VKKPADILPFKRRSAPTPTTPTKEDLRTAVFARELRHLAGKAEVSDDDYLAALFSEVARVTKRWSSAEVEDLFDKVWAEIAVDRDPPKRGA